MEDAVSGIAGDSVGGWDRPYLETGVKDMQIQRIILDAKRQNGAGGCVFQISVTADNGEQVHISEEIVAVNDDLKAVWWELTDAIAREGWVALGGKRRKSLSEKQEEE